MDLGFGLWDGPCVVLVSIYRAPRKYLLRRCSDAKPDGLASPAPVSSEPSASVPATAGNSDSGGRLGDAPEHPIECCRSTRALQIADISRMRLADARLSPLAVAGRSTTKPRRVTRLPPPRARFVLDHHPPLPRRCRPSSVPRHAASSPSRSAARRRNAPAPAPISP